MENNQNLFNELFNIDVSPYVEVKKDLKYLSWAYAIKEVTSRCNSFNYEVERFDGRPYLYDPLLGYMVFTKVTIDGVTKEMFLPVMNENNKAMKAEPYSYETKNGVRSVEAASMFDINKTIMRCLVKNIAMFGLGLSLYIGDDLPGDNSNRTNFTNTEKKQYREATTVFEKNTQLNLSVGDIVPFDGPNGTYNYVFKYSQKNGNYFFMLENLNDEAYAPKFVKANV